MGPGISARQDFQHSGAPTPSMNSKFKTNSKKKSELLDIEHHETFDDLAKC